MKPIEELTQDCENLKAVFTKAKEKNISLYILRLSVSMEASGFSILEAHDDYALVKEHGDPQDHDEILIRTYIHPYGSNIGYITDSDS